MGFFDAVDTSVAPLAQNLSHRAARHSLIAANIANVDTPGYRAVDVSFQRELENAGVPMAVTSAGHMGSKGISSKARMDLFELNGPARRDGNNVNIDHEMVKLAENQLEYRFMSRMLNRKFSKLREAITGRAA